MGWSLEYEIVDPENIFIRAIGPERQLLFNKNFQFCLEEIVRGESFVYSYTSLGKLLKIAKADNSQYVEFIYGSNGQRLIAYLTSEGTLHYYNPNDQPTGDVVDILIQIDGKGDCIVRFNKNTGDYQFISNPHTFGEVEVNFLFTRIKEIRAALEKDHITYISDGGLSLFVSKNGITKLEIPYEDLDISCKKYFSETTSIIGINRTETGGLSILQKV